MATLYVVFHGLCSLFEDKAADKYRAILISMDSHRTAAGHWLTELTVPKGLCLELTSVTPGSASLDPTTNIILTKGLDPAKRQKFRHAEILLPRPRATYSFNTYEIKNNLQGADLPALGSNTKISETRVFEYDLIGDNAILRGDAALGYGRIGVFFTSLKPLPTSAGNSVSTIHVVNEPEHEPNVGVTDAHIIREFQKSTAMYGADLTIKKPTISDELKSGPIPPGILDEELLPLSERKSSVFNIVAAARQKTAYVPLAPVISGNKVCAPVDSGH